MLEKSLVVYCIKSREFAIKWHSSKNAAIKFDKIYGKLLNE